jgi:beta-galactosidase beta subunit
MVDVETHLKIAREKARAAINALQKGWFSVVGDESFKAVEETIQAYESKKDPLADHRRSSTFRLVKNELQEATNDFKELHKIYLTLGYGYEDGEKARRAIELAKRILRRIEDALEVKILP